MPSTLRPLNIKQRIELLMPKRRFLALKRQVGGMMDTETYRRLYVEVLKLPDLDLVEVGGATGAGSVAIAWALRDSKRTGRLIVVEKCEGGSREKDGDYAANVAMITCHFRRYEVDDHIVLYPHKLINSTAPQVLALLRSPQIAALIHDADGRIARDFFHFWPRLIDGGLIVVDDYEDQILVKDAADGTKRYLDKKLITYRLLNQMIEWGLFEPTFQFGCTMFGRKPAGADISKLDRDRCRSIVEQVQAECRQIQGLSPAEDEPPD